LDGESRKKKKAGKASGKGPKVCRECVAHWQEKKVAKGLLGKQRRRAKASREKGREGKEHSDGTGTTNTTTMPRGSTTTVKTSPSEGV
jgi:hypothetical protein